MAYIYEHILYLEDDPLDIRNMQWLAAQNPGIKLHIVTDFQSCKLFLDTHRVDLLILDQFIQGEHYAKHPELLNGTTYIVLTNGSLQPSFLKEKPPLVLPKPLRLSEFENLVGLVPDQVELPSLKNFETIDNPKFRTEMLQILQQELQNALEKIPVAVDKGKTIELRDIVHKLGGKFAFLQMKSTHALAKSLEKRLTNGHIDANQLLELMNAISHALNILPKQTSKI
jgi:HPt (histidine-containing phosphotransfer) domain-containing protein